MKALIIGGAGFVGPYLAAHLRETYGWDVCVTKLPAESLELPAASVRDLDILQADQVVSLLEAERPDYIFHLAAQSSVAVSWKNPQLTVEINIKGCLNVLDAIRKIASYQPRVLLIGSSEEYGRLPAGVSVVDETIAPHPGNPYAVTKAAQTMLGGVYATAYQMDIMMVRAFNHVGPGQAPAFVVSDFCKQAAEISLGLRKPEIWVGNLSAKRDFTDVRDMVRAYGALMCHGKRGEVYNAGSGHAVSIQWILEEILRQCGTSVTVLEDPNKLRPVDYPIVEANITKLQQDTGWMPQIALEQTIADCLADWRRRLEASGFEKEVSAHA